MEEVIGRREHVPTVDNVYKAAKFLQWYKDPPSFFFDCFGDKPYFYQADVMNMLKRVNNPVEHERLRRLLLEAAGGTGKSKVLSCIALWLTVVLPKFIHKPYSVLIISGSEQQAISLYAHSKMAIVDNPIIASEVEGDPLMSRVYFKDRSVIMAVTNSDKAIQGKHTDCVMVDEGAIAGDFVINDTFRIIGSSNMDLIILSGTPMVFGSKFVDIAENKEKYIDWERRAWDAMDCPTTKKKWEEAKRTLPEDMFTIFWEGKAYAGLGVLIPPLELKKAVKDVPKFFPEDGTQIIAGLDWGWQHYTSLILIQRCKDGVYRVIYEESWRREDMKDIQLKISQVLKEFGVIFVFADHQAIGENQRLGDTGVVVNSVVFNKYKVRMQSHLKVIFHQEIIQIPEIYNELVTELRKYNWTTKQNDDRVDALQLACWGAREEEEQTYSWDIV